MLEMKIKIEAPDLSAAIAKLAEAIAPLDPSILTPDEPMCPAAVAPTPAPAPSVIPAPVAVPVNPTPAPVVSAPTSATAAPIAAPAPVPQPAAPTASAAAVPVAPPPTYTLDQISKAGAVLVDTGKMDQLLALLGKYGVAAVTQLNPDQYGVFATELRALGAQI